MYEVLNLNDNSPSETDPSELKNAILPGVCLPQVLYTALARELRKSCEVITPTNTKFRCEFVVVSSLVKLIISNGAENCRKKYINE